LEVEVELITDIVELLDKSVYLFMALGAVELLQLLASRLFLGVEHYYQLGKSLAAPLGCPAPLGITATIEEISKEDWLKIQNTLPSLDAKDKRELLARQFFYWDGFTNCYVIKNGADIAFIQWIIYPSENSIIKEKYPTKFSPLSSTQVIIENAFTFPRYRGRGYLLHGTAALLDLARGSGYKSAICYIRKDRIASLNEFMRMGFKIIRIMREYKFLGRVWRKL
jgi:hypothetical protein